MADKKNSKTRKRILDAACKLFSEHGFEAVSTRMIADAADTHLGSIHYYFDDKEALYLEVFKLATQSENLLAVKKMVEEDPQLLETPEGKSEIIHFGIKKFFEEWFVVTEDWKRRLIMRELCQVSGVAEKLTEELFKPQLEKCRDGYKTLAQKDSLVESFLWSHIPSCVATFYMLTKPTLERSFDDALLREVYAKLADMSTMMMVQLLGLPVPKGIPGDLFQTPGKG